jgi:signal transduction histidine kinase
MRHEKEKAKRIRFQYVVAGIILTFVVILITNLVLPFVGHDYRLVGAGPFATLILIGSIAYAVVKHRLFQLRLAVARSVAYFSLVTVLVISYIALTVAISNLFLGNAPNQGQNFVNVVLALILAATFEPLRRRFERITDSIFFRDRYDSQVVLNNFSGILVSELNLDRMIKRTITDICTQLHIQFGQIVVFNHDRVYRIEHYGPLPKRLMVVPELRRLNHPVMIADELPEGNRKELLDEHGIRVSLMLRTREEFIGYLLLGDKLSGDIYSTQDLEILEIIAKQMAVAILNAKSYAEIQEFNQTLQARVDHATSRLRVANRHLKELDKAKDEFISMASHQLRTPLTTIKGYLSMMLEGDAGHMSKAQLEFAGYAFGSSERMVNLISDLLNVSRLSAGRFLIQTKPTDMVDMIRDEVRQLETHASVKDLKLIFEPPAEALPLAEIDDNKTRQVVMNFIDNAIYYTPSGGSVTVTLDQTGEYVRLRVTDTGIGVPEVAKKKLFSKFFRADNAQTVRPDGTGLGLYLARRVVEDQGGTILFSSTLGKGSTFGFELPLRPAAAKQKEGISGN